MEDQYRMRLKKDIKYGVRETPGPIFPDRNNMDEEDNFLLFLEKVLCFDNVN